MRILRPIALTALVTACSFGLDSGVSGTKPDLPGCDQATAFAFIGKTTLDAIGLGEFGGPAPPQVGTVWVTADKVQTDVGPGRDAGGAEPARMVCVEWADGSGMVAPLPDGWQPPVAAPTPATLPIAPIVVAIVILSLLGVSILAFRRERPAHA